MAAANNRARAGRPTGNDRAAVRTAPAAAGPALVLLWYALVHEGFGSAWPQGIVTALGIFAAAAALGLMWFVNRQGLVSASLLLVTLLAGAVLVLGIFLDAAGGGSLVILAGIVLWIGVFCAVVARIVLASRR